MGKGGSFVCVGVCGVAIADSKGCCSCELLLSFRVASLVGAGVVTAVSSSADT